MIWAFTEVGRKGFCCSGVASGDSYHLRACERERASLPCFGAAETRDDSARHTWESGGEEAMYVPGVCFCSATAKSRLIFPEPRIPQATDIGAIDVSYAAVAGTHERSASG